MTRGRRTLAVAGVALAACLACAVSTVPAASAAEGCENEARRVEQGSTYLPDCRAYELIAPTGYESAEPQVVELSGLDGKLSSPEGMQASISGDRIAWPSQYPSPQSTGLNYLSTREANGWSTEDVIPPQSPQLAGLLCPLFAEMAAYSGELTRGVLADGFGQEGDGFEGEYGCGHDEPLLVPGEPVGFQNLFLRDNESVSYQLVDVTPAGTPAPKGSAYGHYWPAAFVAGSSDLSRVVFEEGASLVAGAGSGDELYDYFEGAVHLISYLPGGTPVHGVLGGSTPNWDVEPHNLADYRHAMSADGSRVFFEAEGNLYARTNPEQPAAEECASAGKACSVQLDEAQAGAEGPSGGGSFMVASEDGSRVFFTDANRLTVGSHAEAGKPDLYEYDFERPVGSRLVDMTAGTGVPGEVLGVSGASGSGEDVYFVAEAALTGSQKNSDGAFAQADHPNLYLAREGALTFIASLDQSADYCDYWPSIACRTSFGVPDGGLTSRVSGNGAFIVFESDLELTGYDNEGPSCVPMPKGDVTIVGYEPGRCQEIYLYSLSGPSANRLECVSCDPDRAAPAGPAIIHFPSDASKDASMTNTYPQRYVSNSGQVFFESKDPLVAAATNGQYNVYEYENGKQYLISSGTSNAGSYFLDASPDGSNIFFATPQALLKRAEGAVYSMYDARIRGGFRAQSESLVPPACQSLEGCHSPLSEAPAEFSVASAELHGSGNLAAAPQQPGAPEKPQVKKPVKKLTRKQQLKRALQACTKRYRHKPSARHDCERQARKHYGAKQKRAGK